MWWDEQAIGGQNLEHPPPEEIRRIKENQQKQTIAPKTVRPKAIENAPPLDSFGERIRSGQLAEKVRKVLDGEE
jgi:hypothetical protein